MTSNTVKFSELRIKLESLIQKDKNLITFYLNDNVDIKLFIDKMLSNSVEYLNNLFQEGSVKLITFNKNVETVLPSKFLHISKIDDESIVEFYNNVTEEDCSFIIQEKRKKDI